MPQNIALSLSIGVLGAIWAYIALIDPLSSFLLVWAGFIAWGCFFHTGGDDKALVKTIVGNIYGIFVAWIALLVIVNYQVSIPIPGPIWSALVVGVTVFAVVIVAAWEPLSVVPANVYGYAATFAYALSVPSPTGTASGPMNNLQTVGFENPLVILIVSMVIGALLGWLSQWIAARLTKQSAGA